MDNQHYDVRMNVCSCECVMNIIGWLGWPGRLGQLGIVPCNATELHDSHSQSVTQSQQYEIDSSGPL